MFKKAKNWHFSKGVSPWVWSKKKKNKVQEQEVQTVEDWIFRKGLSHGFGPKVAILPFFFLGNILQENVFYDNLERKNAFLKYKNKMFKKVKNWHFSKRVNPWVWSRNGHFSKFVFLGKIGWENVFYDIVERKNAYLSYKNKNFKKSKNWHFFQRG